MTGQLRGEQEKKTRAYIRSTAYKTKQSHSSRVKSKHINAKGVWRVDNRIRGLCHAPPEDVGPRRHT